MNTQRRAGLAEKAAASRIPAKRTSRGSANTSRGENESSQLANVLWFTEEQVMPLLSPFWSWRLIVKS